MYVIIREWRERTSHLGVCAKVCLLVGVLLSVFIIMLHTSFLAISKQIVNREEVTAGEGEGPLKSVESRGN